MKKGLSPQDAAPIVDILRVYVMHDRIMSSFGYVRQRSADMPTTPPWISFEPLPGLAALLSPEVGLQDWAHFIDKQLDIIANAELSSDEPRRTDDLVIQAFSRRPTVKKYHKILGNVEGASAHFTYYMDKVRNSLISIRWAKADIQ